MRPTLATISLSALRHNLSVVKKHAPNSQIMAVVKANGYGHGLLNVAKGLSKADGFAVLGINEAIALREAGYRQSITLLEGVFSADELHAVAQYQLQIVVHQREQIMMLKSATVETPISVWLKINTGMNRLGFSPSEFAEVYGLLNDCRVVSNITVMTHFANADQAQGVSRAYSRFQAMLGHLPVKQTLANSAAILLHPETHADWVRPGIMLYGASPVTGQSAAAFGLQAVMSFTSAIISIQTIAKGDGVGYGHLFVADKPMTIGVVACGYADGYPRHAPSGTPIVVNGKLTRTIGRVSMDMLCVDLTELPDTKIGSFVELWGGQNPVDAVAEACGTVGYELLCAISARVPLKVIDGEG